MSSNDMFPEAVGDSPRLSWVKENKVSWIDLGDRFAASKRIKDKDAADYERGELIEHEGATLDEALLGLAVKLEIKPWNWTE